MRSVGHGWWEITAAGQRLSSATAAKPIARGTGDKALREFMVRVEEVNRDARFLGRVNRVVLFGRMLRENVDRVSDVDLGVEVLPKIADREDFAARNARHIESLLRAGHAFRDPLDAQLHWRREVLQFLKGRSRVLSIANYAAEKSLIMNVPHCMLLGEEEHVPATPPEPFRPAKASRRPRDCPF